MASANETALYMAYAASLRPAASHDTRPPVYKAIGISLAISSGLFIGTSFVLKKTGLLKANVKYNEEAGEGYGYLKNAYWWSGMTLMIVGEICNFVAYAFVDAILVTPLGALSVVITTILSAIFLKERLSFVGKVGCFLCIVGSMVIVMNAPAQSSAGTIQDMKHFVLAPGFLSYAAIVILGCTFVALWVGPRYGKKSMMVYLTICSLVGGLSVVATQGLGAAVVAQAAGKPQFNQWFLYVLLVFVVATLLTEIIFLNKALNLFNAALVTPTYYVYFTSSTIVTSAILFQGFKGTPTSIITVVMGFLVICSGVILLQLSKSAKDVPDTAVFKGDLDQVRTVAEQEEPESEPKADAIRGTAAIIRRISQSRQKIEAAEAKRVHEERMRDHMEPIGENEHIEWDGLRRRKTVVEHSDIGPGGLQRRKTLHPPLGMTKFPDDWEEQEDPDRPLSTDVHGGGVFHGALFDSFRRRNQRKDSLPSHSRTVRTPNTTDRTVLPQRPLTEVVSVNAQGNDMHGIDTAYHSKSMGDGPMELSHIYGLPSPLNRNLSSRERTNSKPIAWASEVEDHPGGSRAQSSPGSVTGPTPPPHQNQARRQFSFQNPFSRNRTTSTTSSNLKTGTSGDQRPSSRHRGTIGSRQSSKEQGIPGINLQIPGIGGKAGATEEERLGLVKGDSNALMPNVSHYTDDRDDDDWRMTDDRDNSPLRTAAEKERERERTLREREYPRLVRDQDENGPRESNTGAPGSKTSGQPAFL